MPFSQIIPPSPSPSESKSSFYTSVSLLLSLFQGHHYDLSKFRIYVSVYCKLNFCMWVIMVQKLDIFDLSMCFSGEKYLQSLHFIS